MWQDKLKEIIYILENSNVNEIEVNFGAVNIVCQSRLMLLYKMGQFQ